jgi:hypothetical protein
MGLRSH